MARGRPILGSLVAVLLTQILLVTGGPSTRAEAYDERAAARAHQFLASATRGRDVLEAVHFGTQYVGHTYNAESSRRLTRQLPDRHFALVYRYYWNRAGETDVAFLCDARGNVYSVRADWTNAVVNQPFVFANLTIHVVGNAMIQAYRNDLTPEQRRRIEKVVAEVDARALLGLGLQLQQAFRF